MGTANISEMVSFVKKCFNTDNVHVNRMIEALDVTQLTVVYDFFIVFGTNTRSMKIYNDVVGTKDWVNVMYKLTEDERNKSSRKSTVVNEETIVEQKQEHIEAEEKEEDIPVETDEPVQDEPVQEVVEQVTEQNTEEEVVEPTETEEVVEEKEEEKE